jgi:hypothetical protein
MRVLFVDAMRNLPNYPVMALFALIAPEASPALKEKIEQEFPDDAHFEIADGQFFVIGNKLTTTQVKDKLGIEGGRLGRVAVLRVDNWAGWHSRTMWEWLRNHERDIADAPDG